MQLTKELKIMTLVCSVNLYAIQITLNRAHQCHLSPHAGITEMTVDCRHLFVIAVFFANRPHSSNIRECSIYA